MSSGMSWGSTPSSASATPAGSPDLSLAETHELIDTPRESGFLHQIQSWLESSTVLAIASPSPAVAQIPEEELGTGTFFNVQKREMEINGVSRLVAVKRLNSNILRSGTFLGSKVIRTLQREVLVMRTMSDSPFIVDLLDILYESGSPDEPGSRPTLYTVVELATKGTLSDFLDIRNLNEADDLHAHVASRYQEKSYAIRKSLLIDIAKGMFALHTNAIFHTDLKPSNILIFQEGDEEYHAKLSDFSSSVVRIKGTSDHRVLYGRDSGGTEGYMAPELSRLSPEDVLRLSDSELRRLDIFSFGPVLAEVISSCKAPGFPLLGRYNSGSIRLLDFARVHIGDTEWDTVILNTLEQCCASPSSRCDDASYLLSLLGKDHPSDLPATAVPFDSSEFVLLKASLALEDAAEAITEQFEDRDLASFLKEFPVAAFESLGCLRYFRTGTGNIQPFQEVLLESLESFAPDTPERFVLSSLSSVFGCGPIDFERCCADLQEAADRKYEPAQIIQRRLPQALYSIPDIGGPPALQKPTSEGPQLQTQLLNVDNFLACLDRIQQAYPDNFTAHAIRCCERRDCAEDIYDTLCASAGDNIIIRSYSWDFCDHAPIRDENIQAFVRERTEDLRMAQVTPKASTDYDFLLAAAIVFGDDESTELTTLCAVLADLGLSFNTICIESLWEGQLISPLMLACRCGLANAVRILSEAGEKSSDPMSNSNNSKSISGQLPLHFLFTFQDDDVDDMCRFLSTNVRPEETFSGIYVPSGDFCNLFGTPLDIALKVGSLAATRKLWREIYSKCPAFGATISTFPTIGLMGSRMPSVVDITDVYTIFAIKCWSSMQPSIWDFFLSGLDTQAKTQMQSFFEQPILGGEEGDCYGYNCFSTGLFSMYVFQLSSMILHGVDYTSRLAWHLQQGIRFFLDLDDPGLAQSLLRVVELHYPDPHFQAAMVQACHALLGDFDLDTWKAIMFIRDVEGVEQRSSHGHSIGFVMSRTQPAGTVLEALAATAMANDTPAFRRILARSAEYGINLVDEGITEFLLARFAKSWPVRAGEYLEMVSDMPAAIPTKLPWIARCLPARQLSYAFEHQYTDTGRLLGDAIMYRNLDLLLVVLDRDPALLYPGVLHPGVFLLLCVNDRYQLVLKGLLDHLGPSRSLDALRRRTRIIGLSAIDVAIYHRSTQCLLQIASSLATGGFALLDLNPGGGQDKSDPFGSLLGSLLDCARGDKFASRMVLLMAAVSTMRLGSHEWRPDLEASIRTQYAPRKSALVTFALEMSRNDKHQEEAIKTWIKENCEESFNRDLAAEEHNQDDEGAPGRLPSNPIILVNHVRFLCALGIAARRWRVGALVTGVAVCASVTVGRSIIAKICF